MRTVSARRRLAIPSGHRRSICATRLSSPKAKRQPRGAAADQRQRSAAVRDLWHAPVIAKGEEAKVSVITPPFTLETFAHDAWSAPPATALLSKLARLLWRRTLSHGPLDRLILHIHWAGELSLRRHLARCRCEPAIGRNEWLGLFAAGNTEPARGGQYAEPPRIENQSSN